MQLGQQGRNHLIILEDISYCRRISIRSQTRHYRHSFVAEIRMVTEGIPRVYVCNVNFYKLDRHADEGIADGDASMGVRAGIDDDEINVFLASLVDPVDNSS